MVVDDNAGREDRLPSFSTTSTTQEKESESSDSDEGVSQIVINKQALVDSIVTASLTGIASAVATNAVLGEN